MALGRHFSFRTRIVLMLAAYAVMSAAVVAVILQQLRSEVAVSSQNTLTAFAQLSDEQTTRTFQNVEQTLEVVEAQLLASMRVGLIAPSSLSAELRRLVESRPFLRAITVLDGQGLVLFSSERGVVGVDLSDRAYFVDSRNRPGMQFQIGTPLRSRTTGEWLIPATRSVRLSTGEFAGVIVASINPHFFDRVWTVEKTIKGQATALWGIDGVMIMRSPFAEQAMGAATFSPGLMLRMSEGAMQGTFEVVSSVDGVSRLVAFRRLAVFPTFVITVAQATVNALAPWRRIAWLAGAGWAVSLATLCALGMWLVAEWNARRAEEDRYLMLFDANSYPMVVLDRASRRLLAVNDAALEEYGWSREEAVRMSASDFYAPGNLLEQGVVRETGGSNPGRIITGQRHRRKNGSIMDVELRSRPIQFGKVPATLVMTQNVTGQIRAEQERHVAEEELRESQERYRTLFDAAPYAALVTDRETFQVLAANDAAVKLYGASRDELLALTAQDFYVPEDWPAIVRQRQDFSADVTTMFKGRRHRRRNGSLMSVEMAVRLIEYQHRAAILTIVTDVGERLRMEQAREAAEEQLRQAQKMEVVGQLTGGVAHDFNNLLMVILANAEEVQEEEGLDPRVKARLEQIAKAVLRASELTSQLLAFSRKQALNPKATDLNELVAMTGKLLRRTLGGHIELVVDLAPDLWTVNIDRAQLETALINLCVNARDATPAGGRLVIQSRNIGYEAGAVPESADIEAGDYVRLSVADTGTGMPPDVLAKVFEPFFTTKDVGKGSGLGLSMVYGFIKQSGGAIGVESEVGRGTVVNLYLPRSDKRVELATVPGTVAMPGGSERILVVEDEPEIRNDVARQLKSLGYDVAEAADGAAGLAAFEAAEAPYDMLLTDVVMPGPLNGKALAETVSRRWPGTAIAFMSGYSDGTVESSLLTKPFRKHDLARHVREALDSATV
jgi:PAS domain S-box-containing protein